MLPKALPPSGQERQCLPETEVHGAVLPGGGGASAWRFISAFPVFLQVATTTPGGTVLCTCVSRRCLAGLDWFILIQELPLLPKPLPNLEWGDSTQKWWWQQYSTQEPLR